MLNYRRTPQRPVMILHTTPRMMQHTLNLLLIMAEYRSSRPRSEMTAARMRLSFAALQKRFFHSFRTPKAHCATPSPFALDKFFISVWLRPSCLPNEKKKFVVMKVHFEKAYESKDSAADDELTVNDYLCIVGKRLSIYY